MIIDYSALTDLADLGEPGPHTCVFYSTTEDLVGCVAPFLSAGIERNERCLWITDEPLDRAAAITALAARRPDIVPLLASGQMAILDRRDWQEDASRDWRSALEALRKAEAEALADGYAGLRFTAEMQAHRVEECGGTAPYLRQIRMDLMGCRITGLTTCCLERCSGTALLDVAEANEVALVRRKDTWSVIENAGARQHLVERLASKETLLNEIHHRVKNNLQIVSSLLMLKARSFTEPAARQAVDDTLNRIHAMGLIHEMLYRETSGHASIDFADYLRALTEHLVFAYGEAERIAAEVDDRSGTDKAMVPLEAAVPLGIATAEAITNAIKHAFPDGRKGRLSASIGQEGGELVVVIEDDGRGLPPGDNRRQRPGAGMALIRSLVAQVGGRLDVGASASGGTALSIRLPLRSD